MPNPIAVVKAFLPAIIWMGVIFVFSHHQNIETDFSYDFILKKAAHVVEFGVLALLLYRAQGSSWTLWIKRHAEKAWAWSVLYAVFDEVHQAFVPTRTASPRDVVIDSLGAFLALALWSLFLSRAPKPDAVPINSARAVPFEQKKPATIRKRSLSSREAARLPGHSRRANPRKKSSSKRGKR